MPKGYHWQELANGIEAAVIENRKVPPVTIEIAAQNGAYTEGPEYSGLLHLVKHLFFKADKDNSDQGFFETYKSYRKVFCGVLHYGLTRPC